MKKFGYAVPTTLGAVRGAQRQGRQPASRLHHGHRRRRVVAGDLHVGGPSARPVTSPVPKTITVDTSNANCVKAAGLMDHMIANKTMSTQSLFGPDFAKTEADKILMLPGPVVVRGRPCSTTR